MSAIFTTPIAAAAFPVFKSRKFQEPRKLFARRFEFGAEFHCRRAVSWSIFRRNLRIVKGSNWVRASGSDEGVPAFEQEESLSYADAGLQAAVNSMSKWLIATAFLAFIIWRHDAEAVWALVGSGFNDKLSIVLKQILNQERPNSTLRSDPGMPSSHAQTITYATIFIIRSIVDLYGLNTPTITLSGVLIILGSYFTWLRVSQNLHTVSQVVVGAILGTSFSFLWSWSWKAYVVNLFDSILWIRILIIVFATGFLMDNLYYNRR